MKIHNTLTRQIEELVPIDGKTVRMYACGPTVYDTIHIGNLSSFIYADILRRTLNVNGFTVRHVMNFTDVDDKTIKRSQEKYPDAEPMEALRKLTTTYSDEFMTDMRDIGNDVENVEFIKATDSIEAMRQLITELHQDEVAYITDDGVYFSIDKYRKLGKTYGQLTEITEANTSVARIQNDEYDKDYVHDFALWKKQKSGEPAWSFELDGKDVTGRPGWHIECSAMSVAKLGQPFDIHTGGIDLIFPHHENEIAQSTAINGDMYAKYFFHNEHLFVDGKKMSKSLKNFYTLRDIQEKGFNPRAFRLMVLQSHYRNQTHFTWENIESAQNRLKDLQALADLRWQTVPGKSPETYNKLLSDTLPQMILESLAEDIKTPELFAILSRYETEITEGYRSESRQQLVNFLEILDNLLGLGLLDSQDISADAKDLIARRQDARDTKDWATSDKLREELLHLGVNVRDTELGTFWSKN